MEISSSNDKGFDLYSFWFGCSVTQLNPQAPGVPISCQVSVTGTLMDGTELNSAEEYDFASVLAPNDKNQAYKLCHSLLPNAIGGVDPCAVFEGSYMNQAVLPDGYRDLKSVKISVTSVENLPAGQAALLDVDDISVCVRS